MKILLVAVLAFCVLVSCKKSNSGSSNSYHFTATVDGKAQTFNVSPLATRITAYGITDIVIEGFNGTSSSNTQTLSLGWVNSSANSTPFGTGTWSDTSRKYAIAGVYAVPNTDQYASGTNVTGQASLSGVTITNHFKITITSMDSTAIKGTFSGDFYDMGNVSGAKKTITNGDFFVPWKK